MRAIQRQFSAFLLLVATAVLPASAAAATNILVKYGQIQGQVNLVGLADRIEVDSFSWGLTRSVNLSDPKGGAGTIGLPFSSDVSLVKVLDNSSADLAAEFLAGQPEDAVISIVDTLDGKSGVERFRLELCDAVISSVSSAVSVGGNLEEHLTISFRAFKLVYTEIDVKTGAPTAQTPVSWDFQTQTVGGCSVNG